MNLPTLYKAGGKGIVIQALLGVMVAFSLQCMDNKVAGTTSSTENPSIIAMAFKTGGDPKNITGQMQIFSAYHNPVFDSLPLAVFSLDDQDSISIPKKDIDSIVRNEMLNSTADADSLYSLNFLVRSDANEGGITQGLVYDYKTGCFLDLGRPVRRSAMEIDTLIHYEGGLKISSGESTLTNYLYIAGTPFFTILNNETGRFSFKQMPRAGYKVLYLPTGYKVTGSITYNIIALDDSLRTDSSRVFTPVAIEDTLQSLPKPLRRPD